MCRVFGCVAAEPASIRHELIEAENPLIRQSEDHDSGWGMAVYERADGLDPRSCASPRPPSATRASSRRPRSRAASSTSTCAARRWAAWRSRTRTRSASAATRSATTARSCATRACSSTRASTRPSGDTDSEAFFNFLMTIYDAGDPIGSLRRAIRTTVERSPFSGLNFLFSDGDRLFAYRLGLFELHWLHRPGPAAGRLGAASPTSTGTPSSRTCCWCSTRMTSTSPTPSA